LESASTSALSSRQNFSGNQSGFSTGSEDWACASVVLVGALDSSVPSVVVLRLAGAVDAGTAVLSAVALLTSLGVLVVVASLMVFVGLLF
jgi:hypothetical protein